MFSNLKEKFMNKHGKVTEPQPSETLAYIQLQKEQLIEAVIEQQRVVQNAAAEYDEYFAELFQKFELNEMEGLQKT